MPVSEQNLPAFGCHLLSILVSSTNKQVPHTNMSSQVPGRQDNSLCPMFVDLLWSPCATWSALERHLLVHFYHVCCIPMGRYDDSHCRQSPFYVYLSIPRAQHPSSVSVDGEKSETNIEFHHHWDRYVLSTSSADPRFQLSKWLSPHSKGEPISLGDVILSCSKHFKT